MINPIWTDGNDTVRLSPVRSVFVWANCETSSDVRSVSIRPRAPRSAARSSEGRRRERAGGERRRRGEEGARSSVGRTSGTSNNNMEAFSEWVSCLKCILSPSIRQILVLLLQTFRLMLMNVLDSKYAQKWRQINMCLVFFRTNSSTHPEKCWMRKGFLLKFIWGDAFSHWSSFYLGELQQTLLAEHWESMQFIIVCHRLQSIPCPKLCNQRVKIKHI